MPTLERYDDLMKSGQYHEAAREACTRAAALIKAINEAGNGRNEEDTLQSDLPLTVDRYLHAFRRAVRTAIDEGAHRELRSMRRDKDVMSTLDGEELRNELDATEDDIPTLPDGFSPS